MAKIYCKSSYLLRRDTAENWQNKNPILREGEEGYETDTGRRKIGDGMSGWNSLEYNHNIAVNEAKAYTDAKISEIKALIEELAGK